MTLHHPFLFTKKGLTIGNIVIFTECGVVNRPLRGRRTNLPSIVPPCENARLIAVHIIYRHCQLVYYISLHL